MSYRRRVPAWALTAALCALPVMSLTVSAQEPADKQQTRDEERDKKSKKDTRAEKDTRDKSGHEAESRDSRPQPAKGSEHAQPQTRASNDRKSANAHYHFRAEDRSKLRPHFQAQLAHVDRAHRPHVAAGVTLQPTYQTVIEPVPQDVIVYLAPPPPGYEFGFLDGYVLVYDPSTFFVIDVIDLL